MSTASFVEASLVLEATRGYEGLRDLDLLLAKAGMEFVPVDLAIVGIIDEVDKPDITHQIPNVTWNHRSTRNK